MTSSVDPGSLRRLGRNIDGRVMLAGDEGYDSARAVWNAMVDRRPAVVVRCTSSADVAAAIDFARRNGLEVGVRCGGHSVLGISVPDGGLLIDLSGLRAVHVDAEARRARVQGGALLGDLDRAAQAFGLATTAGNVSHTGVSGLTLGGGMGWLARRLGLACDNVDSYEIVTADGATLRVSESQHEDLFWGLRGGGGNFGVVTEFEFRLHEVGTSALLVDRTFDLAEAPSAMRRWRDLLGDNVPREATPVAWIGTMVDSPGVPSQLRNRTVASLGFVWVGDPDNGLRRLVPWVTSLGAPLAERVEELPYLRLQTVDDEWHRPGLRRRYFKGHYLRELSDEAIDTFLSHTSTCWVTRETPVCVAPTQPASCPGWLRSNGDTTRATSSISTRTSGHNDPELRTELANCAFCPFPAPPNWVPVARLMLCLADEFSWQVGSISSADASRWECLHE